MANKIIEEVLKNLPKDAKISNACFEGANIVLYTKNAQFFLENGGIILEIVDKIKKRVELRPDPSLTLDMEETKKIIEKIIPKEAENTNIIFDPQRSIVIIEAEKPGLAIGKGGEILKEIRKKTLWVSVVKRIPAIRSLMIETIRSVLYENNDYRKKFLNKIGERIYSEWNREKKQEWVRISCLGGGREVGRSCFLLQTQESNVLVDCGINVASNNGNSFPHLEAPEFNIGKLDAVIISHAHLDHIGLVPYLYKMGYRGPIYFTEPTRDVGALLCLDLISLSQKEAKNALYSSSDIKEMVKHSVCLEYEEVTDITPDIRITLYNAGHNLGSSLIHFHIGNGLHNFVYSGDFNFEITNLLSPASTRFPRLETVMMESTYGSKADIPPKRFESEEELIKIVNETAKNEGKILMPVLGVGRSQEVMLILEKAMEENKIQKMPIYLQGMLWDVTAIHTAYPEFFNNKVKKSIFQQDHNPFLSDIFKRVKSQQEMEEVIENKGPYIIMATSGMLTGGASLTYFKAFAENPRNTLVLTCYQGEGSLGRRLQNGEKEIVFIEGGSKKQEVTNVKMAIFSLSGFSGHSNFEQLISWARHLEPKPKKIIVVHGEQSKALELASTLHQLLRIETEAPKTLEVIRLK